MLRAIDTADNWLCDRAEDVLDFFAEVGVDRREVLLGMVTAMGLVAAVSDIFLRTSFEFWISLLCDGMILLVLIWQVNIGLVPRRSTNLKYRLFMTAALFVMAVLYIPEIVAFKHSSKVINAWGRMIFWLLYTAYAYIYSCRSDRPRKRDEKRLSLAKLKELFHGWLPDPTPSTLGS